MIKQKQLYVSLWDKCLVPLVLQFGGLTDIFCLNLTVDSYFLGQKSVSEGVLKRPWGVQEGP